jgi:general secretion pathway protein G
MMRVRAGFTLIELLVTLAIIGLLASAVVPLAELVVKRSKEQELSAALRQIRGALDEYKRAVDEGRVTKKADESGYPPSLEVLVAGVENAKDPNKAKIYFLRRLPRDPFFDSDSAVPPERTWGKRSYASPPDTPEEGKDVFDVYSLSEGKGLNGIPYREW